MLDFKHTDRTRREFESLSLEHLDALYSAGLRLTRNERDSEDLVQDTYLRAFRFSHRFEPGTHLRAWLFQILRNTFLTFYRRDAHQPVLFDQEREGAEDAADPDAPVAAVATALDLERALGELPEEFRAALLLADLEGFALGEIAQIMDTPVGTVKSRLFRARRLLRRRLADYREG